MSRGSHQHHAQSAPGFDPTSAHDPHEQHGGHRHPRLQRILHEELAALLRDEIVDPALDSVTFTSVELSVDYRHARVYFVADEDARARSARALARAAPFFRARLADSVDLKQIPALSFLFDAEAVRQPQGRQGAAD